eukprot:4209315-Pyramimonas_sp.AAC.1
MSCLESRPAAEATRKDYFNKMRSYLQWALESGLVWKDVERYRRRVGPLPGQALPRGHGGGRGQQCVGGGE